MGKDSIVPFITNPENGVFILCKTSNPSGADFQNHDTDGLPLYEKVASWANSLNKNNNVGLVVGATVPNDLERVREISHDLPLLIPGVGAQGGDLEQSVKIGNQSSVGIINVSRGISFAGDMGSIAIRSAAKKYVNKMRNFMDQE
jgi:orotidine-5'-phosphate decarboxylase